MAGRDVGSTSVCAGTKRRKVGAAYENEACLSNQSSGGFPLGQALLKLRRWIDVAHPEWGVDDTDETVYGVCCHAALQYAGTM